MRLRLIHSAILVIMFLVACAPQAVRSQSQPRKHALIIGINKYLYTLSGVRNLNYATADADTLEIVLKSLGYGVTKVPDHDATRRRIISELHRYAHEVKEQDDFVLFFSGHGIRDRVVDKTFWLTYDAEPSLLDYGGIRLDHLMDYLGDIKAARKLVLLDHCFSGDVSIPGISPAGGVSATSSPPSTSPPLAVISRAGSDSIVISRNVIPDDLKPELISGGKGMVVIAAARNEAYEPLSLGHGVFTYTLLRALTTRQADSVDIDAKLSVEELKAYLHKHVKRLAAQSADKEQDIVESTAGQNLNSWFIADRLPLNDTEKLTNKAKYKETLLRWEEIGSLSEDNSIFCREVLVKWAQATDVLPVLDEKESSALNEIIKHMDKYAAPPPGLSESAIANSLNDKIQRIRTL